MLPDLIVTSLDDAPAFLKQKKSPVHCIISIGDPGEKKPHGFHHVPARLRLEFHDVRTDNGDPATLPPDREHVERIVTFTNLVAGKRTLIHCHAGISRATAAAYVMTAKLLGPGREMEALDHILALRPIAYPNTRMVRFGDDVLGRDGALFRALVDRNRTLPELEAA